MTSSGKSNRAIVSLKKRARKGDFFSSLQLAKYYEEGKYVEKNESISGDFLKQSVKLFERQRLKLNSISFFDFRLLKDVSLSFPDENLIVVAGINGAGKTSFLDGVAKCLSWLSHRITSKGGNGDFIEQEDICIGNESSCSSINSSIYINDNVNISMELFTSKDGIDVSKKNDVVQAGVIGNFYKYLISRDEGFNLPLLAYYSVDRALDISKKDFRAFSEEISFREYGQVDGLKGALHGKADFRSFLAWFKYMEDVKLRRKDTGSAAHLSNNMPFIETLKELAEHDENARNLLAELEEKREAEYLDEPEDGLDKVIEFMNVSIGNFMDGYSNLKINLEPTFSLTIEKDGKSLNVLQLSQGEKSLLALILDITRRLVILNPNLKDPLDGSGIVLIDEVDLHLHPKWQREVTKALTRTFKNCQFIVTTHSPQVLGEVNAEQIFLFDDGNGNGISSSVPSQAFGLSSNEILRELMSDSESQSLDRNEEVKKAVDEIYRLISENDLDKARENIEALSEELGGDIPELIQARVEIDLMELD